MYEMETLSDLHSKELFFKRIFGSENCCLTMLKQVSKEILKKCGGLPLAIISISSLLANKPPLKDEWEKVRRSIGSALDKNRSLDGTNSILCLSYNNLSPNLKTCLLYLTMFPEDYVIKRESLVRRWIAEGVISEERGLSKQDVAENYFYELINKSMVQPVDVRYGVVGHWEAELANHHGFIRRLSVQHIDQDLVPVLANEHISHVRSLTVITVCNMKHLPALAKFETLRVLDLQGCEDLPECDMDGIDKLYQLRYLSLRGTKISKLPSGIVRLYGLETLDLSQTDIKEMPPRIIQLTNLQYLLIKKFLVDGSRGLTKIPNGIGNMSNLRVIRGFNIIQSSLGAVEELGNLTNLNELHLQLDSEGCQECKRHEEILLSSLCKLGNRKLQSLRICSHRRPLQFLDSWSPLPSSLQRFVMISCYYLAKIPKWIAPTLTCLAYLNINLVKAMEEDLGILGEMPSLISLVLTFKTNQKERLTIRGYGFPCLKELYIYSGYGNGLTNLLFEDGALPELEKLDVPFVVSWAKACGFYLGIGHLPRLKHARIALRNYVNGRPSENGAAEIAIRNEAKAHSNHPRLIIRFRMLWEEEFEKESDTNKEEN